MNIISKIELRYADELTELLRSGDDELLKSHHWDKDEIEKRITFASTFFPELRSHEVVFLFTHDPSYAPKALGSMHPPLCPIVDVDNPDLIGLRKARPEAFIINFWGEIFSYDEIDQIINISHEFQHVVQHITNNKYYWYCRIMYCLVESMQDEELPTEIEAERASKKVIEAIYGKPKVDDWVYQQLDKRPHSFFIRFGHYDIKAEYDLKKRTVELWEINHLNEKVDELRNKKSKNNKQQRILKMYDNIIKETAE